MARKRLRTRDENGWPYCLGCRKEGRLLLARQDLRHPDQPAEDKSCEEHQSRHLDGLFIEWRDFVIDQPCVGCGLPYIDTEPWSGARKGSMYYTEEERAVAHAEQVRYWTAHPNCHAGRHRLQGSLISHCVTCCPMPPMSPDLRKRVAPILRRILLGAVERQQAVTEPQ